MKKRKLLGMLNEPRRCTKCNTIGDRSSGKCLRCGSFEMVPVDIAWEAKKHHETEGDQKTL